MPRAALASWCVMLSFSLAGCAENSMVMKNQLAQSKQQQENLTKQTQQLQAHAAALDRDNKDLNAALAQIRQEAKLAEENQAALRDQLRSVTSQLAQVKSEKAAADQQVNVMNASLRRQTGTTITPNNSFLKDLPVLSELPQGYVRRDGDVIRITLPGRALFEPGSARMTANGRALVARAGAELVRLYPDQMIGVEGYTDTDTNIVGPWKNNHEVSAARALVVAEVLTSQVRLQPDQLFVVGHGAAQPIASNATPDGKETNRRVELVVYPERRGQAAGR